MYIIPQMTGIQYQKRLDVFNPTAITSNFYFQVRSELINGKSIRLVGFTQIVVKKLLACVMELENISDFVKIQNVCVKQWIFKVG